jgi:hypothetical protein
VTIFDIVAQSSASYATLTFAPAKGRHPSKRDEVAELAPHASALKLDDTSSALPAMQLGCLIPVF